MIQMETCSVFELAQDSSLLDGLSLVSASLRNDRPEDTGEMNKEQKVQEPRTLPFIPEVSDRMFCSTCQCPFDVREEQTEHYKLDWHRFNLKRRIVGGAFVTADEFEERTCAGDLSSISGSDTDSSSEDEESELSSKHGEETNATKTGPLKLNQPSAGLSSKVLFRNTRGQLLAIYQCVLGPSKDCALEEGELVASLKGLQVKPCWVILMAGGGHFAGAVFRGSKVLEHKTFHRYTVRAKRGTSQGLRDSQGRSNMPKSAGASLRRYNEAALLKDVQELLESWSQHLKEAQTIFLRAPSHNKTIFFSRKNALFQKSDPRLCNIPFVTRRATFKEVQRVHTVLSTLQVYGKDTLVAEITSPVKKDWKKVKKAPKEEPPDADAGTSPGPSEDDNDGPEGEMEMVEVTLDTLCLREFEVLPKRNHKKKKKAGKKPGRDFSAKDLEDKDMETVPLQPPTSASKTSDCQEVGPGCKRKSRAQSGHGTLQEPDDASYQLRNDLFTACKTGDVDSLLRLLRDLTASAPGTRTQQQEDIPPAAVPAANMEDPTALQMVPTLPSKGITVNTTPIPCETDAPTSNHGDFNVQCDSLANPSNERQEPLSTGALQDQVLVNERIDTGGFTLLHVAASAGQGGIVSLLMDAGWDPALRDDLGQTPYAVSSNKQTRNAFRKYSAEQPGKYNYVKSQIPPPLTAELEAKKEEKKRAQKTLKKQREKVEKEEKKRKEEEEAEKKRFAALSDREKRALAAEKRLAAQLSTSGVAITNTRRCWQCGEDLLGKIPFQYLDFSFCSTRCLQEHRKASRSAKT